MKVAWDFDGVLCDVSVTLLSLMKGADMKIVEWYWRERKPLLDPRLFLAEEDTFFIITARDPAYWRITNKWLKRWIGNMNYEYICVGDWSWDKHDEIKILDQVSEAKAKAINDNKIDIYFDDSEYIVKKLRQLCPNCKVIHYGGRV